MKDNKCEDLLVQLIEEEISQSPVTLNNKQLNGQLFKFLLKNNDYKILIKLIENSNIPLEKLYQTVKDKVDLINDIFSNTNATTEELLTLCSFVLGKMEIPDENKWNEILSILENNSFNPNVINKLPKLYIEKWKELPIETCIKNGKKTIELLTLFLEHGAHKFTVPQQNMALTYLLTTPSIPSVFIKIQLITSQPTFQIHNIDEYIDLLVNCKDQLVTDLMISINDIQSLLDKKVQIIIKAKQANNESLCKKILYKSLRTNKKSFDLKDSLLHLSLRDGQEDLIKLFIDQDIYQLNSAGETPLSIALSLFLKDKKYGEIVKLMLETSSSEIQPMHKSDPSYAAAIEFKAYCIAEAKSNHFLLHLFEKNEFQLFKFFSKLENDQVDDQINGKNIELLLDRTLEVNTFEYAACIIENSSLMSLIDDTRKNTIFTTLVTAHEFTLALSVLKSIKLLFDKSIFAANHNIIHTIVEHGDIKNKQHELLLIHLLLQVKDKSFINQTNQNNETPLAICIRTKHYIFAKTIFTQTYKLLNHDDFVNYIHFAYQQEGGCTDAIINAFKCLCERNLSPLLTTNTNKTSLLYIILSDTRLIDICLDTIVQQFNNIELGYLINKILIQISIEAVSNQVKILYDSIYKILEKCNNVDLPADSDISFLHAMVNLNNDNMVKLICAKALSYHPSKNINESAFVMAAKQGKYNLVDIFLGYPSKLNQQEINMVLIMAASAKNYSTMKKILNLSVLSFVYNNHTINANGNTALHYVCADKFNQNPEIMVVFKLLVEQQALLDFPNKDQKTPLHIAIDNPSISANMWSTIISGMNTNNCNETVAGLLLLDFCQMGLFKLALDLVTNPNMSKVDTNLTDMFSKTALKYATEAKHADLTKVLSKNKAQVQQLVQSCISNANLNASASIRNMADMGLSLGSEIVNSNLNDLEGSLSQKQEQALVVRAIQQTLLTLNVQGILDWVDKMENNNTLNCLFETNIILKHNIFVPKWKGRALSACGIQVLKMIKNILLEQLAKDGVPQDNLVKLKIEDILHTQLGLFSKTKSSDIYSKLGTNQEERAKQMLATQIRNTDKELNKLAPLPPRM